MGDEYFYGDDGWDYVHRQPRRRPSAHGRRTGLLDPGYAGGGGGGLYRSRSQGQGPMPTINVYNRMSQDQEGSPYPPPPTSSSRRASPRVSPDRRGRGLEARLGDELLRDELAELALEARIRSRSRGRSDFGPPGWAEYQLAAKQEEELRTASRERARRLEDERIREKCKLDALEAQLKKERADEAQREREQRIVAEHERKQREAADKRKEDERHAVEEHDRKQREAREAQKAEELRIKEKLEREEREAKEKEEKAFRAFQDKQRRDKEAKEKQYNDFLREQREREDKKRAEDCENEAKFQAEMGRRLAHLGYSNATINAIAAQQYQQQRQQDFGAPPVLPPGTTRVLPGPPGPPVRSPVFPKIHRSHLLVETLQYYNLPWKYDPLDPDYYLIECDMNKYDIDLLFRHTKNLRTRSARLLVAELDEERDAKNLPKRLAMYRRRSRSRGAPPGKKEVGILRID